MTVHQLSIFIENKPGRLRTCCKKLAEEQIDIVTLSLADTQEFGILRLIVRDWERAKAALVQAGYAVNVCEVVVATVPDEPGGMGGVLETLEGVGVNIEYMYAFAFRHKNEAVLVFRFDDSAKAIAALTKAGREVLDEATLCSHAAKA